MVHLENGSMINLENGSMINLEKGSMIHLEKGSMINLEKGSMTHLEKVSSMINLKKESMIHLEKGSMIDLEKGSQKEIKVGIRGVDVLHLPQELIDSFRLELEDNTDLDENKFIIADHTWSSFRVFKLLIISQQDLL